MAEAAASLGKADAARDVAEDLLHLAVSKGGSALAKEAN
jgi:hypothetical protein